MKIVEKGTGQVVVHLEGELGHHEALDAMQVIAQEIEMRAPQEMVLDFGGVGFMDSSGIAVVVQSSRKTAQNGGVLAVTGVSKQAMRVFSAAGIQKIVKFI